MIKELFYLSPGVEEVVEIQYDPIMNGSSTWQIYNGPDYVAYLPHAANEWTRISIEVQQHTAKVYIENATEPQLIISNLQLGVPIGKIGVWGYLPCYVRNLAIEELQEVEVPSLSHYIDKLKSEGFLTDWKISQPYQLDSPISQFEWTYSIVEENGTLNLNRLYESLQNNSVIAECEVYIEEEFESILTLGFSDQLRLWINDEEVYQGVWKWNPPEEDGRIRVDHASLPVSWREGLNLIRAEITSLEVIFGWGLSVKTELTKEK